MANDITFSITTTTRFDEDYAPAESSRVTTNFANLARGAGRQQTLRNALSMMNHRSTNWSRAMTIGTASSSTSSRSTCASETERTTRRCSPSSRCST